MSIECFVLRSARLYRAAGQCTVTDEFRIELFYQIDDRPEPGQGTGEPETVLLQVYRPPNSVSALSLIYGLWHCFNVSYALFTYLHTIFSQQSCHPFER